MPDMLVKLLELPSLEPYTTALAADRIIIRRAQAYEQTRVTEFIRQHFGTGWSDEVSVGYANKPVTVYIATQGGRVVGFAAYECTRKAFFGPTGVEPGMRGKGVGAALLVACMHGLRDSGYVYGIIGGAGPTEFYTKVVGAQVIEGSSPGIYTDMLKGPGE